MLRHTLAAIVFLLTILLAVTFRPTAARADYEWDDYLEWREEQAEEYEEQMEDRQEALEEYWEDQRERQRDFNRHRGHAWFGGYSHDGYSFGNGYGKYGTYYVAPSYRNAWSIGYRPKPFSSASLYGSYSGYDQQFNCQGGHCHSDAYNTYRYNTYHCGPTNYDCHRDLRYPYGNRLAVGPLDACWE